jgi:hypothetical protein
MLNRNVEGGRWRPDKKQNKFSLDISIKVLVRDETKKGNKEEKYD